MGGDGWGPSDRLTATVAQILPVWRGSAQGSAGTAH